MLPDHLACYAYSTLWLTPWPDQYLVASADPAVHNDTAECVHAPVAESEMSVKAHAP